MIETDVYQTYRNQVKANYDFASWTGQTKEGSGDVQLRNFLISADELKGWKLEEKEALPPSERQRRITRHIYCAAGEAGPRLVLTVLECHSVLEAHETLIDTVMTSMAARLPRCEFKGFAIGDICFGSHGDVNVSAIFARFNILAEIQRTSPGPNAVDEFARNVDALILSQYRQRL